MHMGKSSNWIETHTHTEWESRIEPNRYMEIVKPLEMSTEHCALESKSATCKGVSELCAQRCERYGVRALACHASGLCGISKRKLPMINKRSHAHCTYFDFASLWIRIIINLFLYVCLVQRPHLCMHDHGPLLWTMAHLHYTNYWL